ncbi:MAG: amino acid racemase [Proteobacteria bacterium]|nr:amino acid racemase [Pseudomonadota bacterium]
MKRIGILGGSSDQATAEYYRRLNTAVNCRLGGFHTAELVISSMDFALAEGWVRSGDWDAAAQYLAGRAQALERAGADVFLCVSNTLHRVADRYTAAVSIPFLHIVDPTARAIRAAGFSRVGLLGTLPVMSTDYLKRRYRDLGVELVVPPPPVQTELDRIIFEELCRGRFLPPAKDYYLAAIDALAADGAEGVILGCTEIPLLVAQADRPAVPMFDTVELHVGAAVDFALG